MSTPRPSLSAAFSGKAKAPDRAASLAGLLSATPARETAPALTKEDAIAQPEQGPQRRTVRQAITRPEATSGGAVTNVGVYLPAEVRTLAQAQIRSRAITYADLLVESFDQVTDDQLGHEFGPLQPVVSGRVMPARVPRRRGEAGIQVQLRLDGVQKLWLDQKVAALAAPSRSALVAAVFTLALKGQRDGR